MSLNVTALIFRMEKNFVLFLRDDHINVFNRIYFTNRNDYDIVFLRPKS